MKKSLFVLLALSMTACAAATGSDDLSGVNKGDDNDYPDTLQADALAIQFSNPGTEEIYDDEGNLAFTSPTYDVHFFVVPQSTDDYVTDSVCARDNVVCPFRTADQLLRAAVDTIVDAVQNRSLEGPPMSAEDCRNSGQFPNCN